MHRLSFSVFTAVLFLTPALNAYDYPTRERVDNVIGCMMSNGFTRISLNKCSCALDYIASKLPFDEYEKAETVASMLQSPHMAANKMGLFKNSGISKDYVKRLKEVQTEATLKCF